MTIYSQRTKKSFAYRFLSAFVAFTFSFSYIVPPSNLYAQGLPATVMNLPVPGTVVPLTPGYTPTQIIGMTIHADNPLMFDFLVDPGDAKLNDQELQTESVKLVKYFLASMTVPAEKLWVNLSPYEKDKIVPAELGQTEMGAEMLAQDYLLKQLTASLMNPEDELGKKFWDRVYAKAQKLYGTTEIPMNTFNKVWILPEKAVVYNNGLNVFVLESHLKVMLEEDYLALEHHTAESSKAKTDVISGVSSSIIKEVLLPEIEKEVNEGKTFAQLRQIYNSLILATWYKNNLKESFLGQVYADKNKTGGLTVADKETSQKIYDQYIAAFEKGVYNFIKEDVDPVTSEIIPRKYFSGGLGLDKTGAAITSSSPAADPAKRREFAKKRSRAKSIQVGLDDEGRTLLGRTVAAAETLKHASEARQKASQKKSTADPSIMTIDPGGAISFSREFFSEGGLVKIKTPRGSIINIRNIGGVLSAREDTSDTNGTYKELISLTPQRFNQYGWWINPASRVGLTPLIEVILDGSLKISNVAEYLGESFEVESAASPVAKTGLSEAVGVAAQRITTAAKANTGELNIDAAIRAGTNGVLAGHSEARANLGDTNEMVNKQLRSAHMRNLKHVLFAFGENLEVREKVGEKDFVKNQIEEGLKGIDADQVAKTIFAYEPIWAIGTGKTATPQQAQEMAKFVRDTVESFYGKEVADKITILYGGSVTPETAAELIAQEDIDGFLVGGASNEYDSFTAIIKTVEAQGPKNGRVPYVGGNHKTKKIKTGYYSELSKFFKTLDTSRVHVSVLPSVGLITEAAQAMASSPVQELRSDTPAEDIQKVLSKIKAVATAEIFTRYQDSTPRLAKTLKYTQGSGNNYSVEFAGATLLDKYGHLPYPTIHHINDRSSIYFNDNAIYLGIYGTKDKDVLKIEGSGRPAEGASRATFFARRMSGEEFEGEVAASSPIAGLSVEENRKLQMALRRFPNLVATRTAERLTWLGLRGAYKRVEDIVNREIPNEQKLQDLKYLFAGLYQKTGSRDIEDLEIMITRKQANEAITKEELTKIGGVISTTSDGFAKRVYVETAMELGVIMMVRVSEGFGRDEVAESLKSNEVVVPEVLRGEIDRIIIAIQNGEKFYRSLSGEIYGIVNTIVDVIEGTSMFATNSNDKTLERIEDFESGSTTVIVTGDGVADLGNAPDGYVGQFLTNLGSHAQEFKTKIVAVDGKMYSMRDPELYMAHPEKLEEYLEFLAQIRGQHLKDVQEEIVLMNRPRETDMIRAIQALQQKIPGLKIAGKDQKGIKDGTVAHGLKAVMTPEMYRNLTGRAYGIHKTVITVGGSAEGFMNLAIAGGLQAEGAVGGLRVLNGLMNKNTQGVDMTDKSERYNFRVDHKKPEGNQPENIRNLRKEYGDGEQILKGEKAFFESDVKGRVTGAFAFISTNGVFSQNGVIADQNGDGTVINVLRIETLPGVLPILAMVKNKILANGKVSLHVLQSDQITSSPLTDLEKAALERHVQELIGPTKNYLAADGSTSTANKLLKRFGVPISDDPKEDAKGGANYLLRQEMRRLFFTAPAMQYAIGGIIVYDEAAEYVDADGLPLLGTHVEGRGMGIIHKSDRGLKPDEQSTGPVDESGKKIEQVSNPKGLGMENLAKVMGVFPTSVADKFRQTFAIDEANGLPTEENIKRNADVMAQHVWDTQMLGRTPTPEPEVLINGNHSIQASAEANRRVHSVMFAAMKEKGVYLPGVVLKTSMVISGDKVPTKDAAEEVARYTVATLMEVVPAEVGAVVFLSGGQKPEQALRNLNAIAKEAKAKNAPWRLAASFSRASKEPALKIWGGKPENFAAAQKEFSRTLFRTQAASLGVLDEFDALIVTIGIDNFLNRVEDYNDMLLTNANSDRLPQLMQQFASSPLTDAQKANLRENVAHLVGTTRNYLAADGSTSTANKLLKRFGVPISDDKKEDAEGGVNYLLRQEMRRLFFTAPAIENAIGGIIVYDEAAKYIDADGSPLLATHVEGRGMGIIHKSDRGLLPDEESMGPVDAEGKKIEQVSNPKGLGIENLAKVMEVFSTSVADKFRQTFTIDEAKGLPTQGNIVRNAETLAQHALDMQRLGRTPTPEPEVLINGGHSIQMSAEVNKRVHRAVFAAMKQKGVYLPGLVYKISMVISGDKAVVQDTPEEVARKTVETLMEVVPAEVGAIVFLSGGQKPEQALRNLNAIAKEAKAKNAPWRLAASFSRASKEPALKIWGGKPQNFMAAQKEFSRTLFRTQAASLGMLDEFDALITTIGIDNFLSRVEAYNDMLLANANSDQLPQLMQQFASSPTVEGEQPPVFYFSTYDSSIDSQLPKGNITNKALLGGKGAGLADMANKISEKVEVYKSWLKDKKGITEAQMTKRGVTIPRVPLGYTITTEQTRHWKERRDRGEEGISPELRETMMEAMKRLETASGKKLGDTEGMPLLVAVRSGAKESMPGMMDTVLNLGMNDRSVLALANASNEKFAWDTYRRFIGMYGSIVLGVKDDEVAHTGFTAILEHMIKERGVKDETQLSAEDYKELVRLFKTEIQRQGKGLIPEDPYEQYLEAVETVMRSTFNERAMVYRAQQKIKLEDTLSAVNVVEMIYGNRNGKSGTGVAFTRDVATGEKKFNLAVAFEAQGEDVVKGRKDGVKFEVMQAQAPDVAETISLFGEFLEEAYGDVQDIEFTFEHDENTNTTNVYMLQTRNAKRTSQAEVRIAVEMFDEGHITKEIAVKRVNAGKLGELLASRFDPAEKTKAIATRALLSDGGLNASPGAGVGIIALDADTAKSEDQRIKAIQERIRRDEPVTDQERQIAKVGGVVLVREETSPDDLGGMVVSKAIATSRGGRTSHAAVVARQFGIPAVVGDNNMVIDFVNRTVTFTRADGSRETLKEGDVISIDGSGDKGKGQVFKGRIGTKPSMIITAQNIESIDKVRSVVALLQGWTDQLTGPNAEILREEYAQHIKDYLSYINEYKDKRLTAEEKVFYEQYKKLMGWASELRQEKKGLGVGANAERPLDVLNAVLNGAERFGLVRTEHMFSGAGRELKFQRMILAETQEARIAALNQLLPQQQADFEQIFLFAEGRPVTIRLIDPPLHEFLPKEPAKIQDLADSLGISVAEVQQKIDALKEENPMFGTRGVRLSILFPEIIEMQVGAIFNAMKKVEAARIAVKPEIMVPLVGNVREFDFVKSRIENIARRQRVQRGDFKIGTMIEIVAAGMNAAEIAKEAEFLSFGTNDYTQGGLKISRDDGKEYLENAKLAGVFTDDPFVTLDPGVALFIKRTAEAARAVNQAIKIGICGEQGVDPTSISRYLAPYGLNYVSGGSLRLPGALLAAAHEALKGHAPLEGKIRTEKPVEKRLYERVADIADAVTFSDQLSAAVDYVESSGMSVAAQRTALANLDLTKEMDAELKRNPDFIKVHSWADALLRDNNLDHMGVKVRIGANVNLTLTQDLIPYNSLGMMTTEEYFLGDDNPIRRSIQAYLLEKGSTNRSQLLSEIKEAVQRSFLENSGDETLTRRTFTVRLPNIALQDIFHYQNDKAFHGAMWSLSQQLGISAEEVRERIAKYHESNSAMGQRGSRIFFTEVAPLYTTIIAAIAQAAVKKEYSSLDFILPFTVNRNEIEVIRSGYADNRGKAVVPSLDQVLKEGRETMAINIGAEIETPSAAATAADIAKAVDGGPVVIDSKRLTEAVWAAFESDVRGAFLETYMREGIWEQDPYKITPADTRLLIQEAIGAIKARAWNQQIDLVVNPNDVKLIAMAQQAGVTNLIVDRADVQLATIAAAQAAITISVSDENGALKSDTKRPASASSPVVIDTLRPDRVKVPDGAKQADTLRVQIVTKNESGEKFSGQFVVPAGSSTGEDEAPTVGVDDAIRNVREIQQAVKDFRVSPDDSKGIGELMLLLEKQRGRPLGAEATLGFQMALAWAVARSKGLELKEYIQETAPDLAPSADQETTTRIQYNITNGGVHADNDLDLQEFMVFPKGRTLAESNQMAANIDRALGELYIKLGLQANTNDGGIGPLRGKEGGYSIPDLTLARLQEIYNNAQQYQIENFDVLALRENNVGIHEFVINALIAAIKNAGYVPSTSGEVGTVAIALDGATSEMFGKATGMYKFEGRQITSQQLTAILAGWSRKYPIESIEDGKDQNDWEGFIDLIRAVGDRVMLIGDDSLVTQGGRLSKFIKVLGEKGILDQDGKVTKRIGILIKLNQNGFLTTGYDDPSEGYLGTLEVIRLAKKHGIEAIISHRSKEAYARDKEVSIAHLAAAVNAYGLKSGDYVQPERGIKEDELARIATASSPATASEEPAKRGGIDLNPGNMDLQTNYGGEKIQLPMPNIPLENIKIDGLVPIIIHVAPVANLPFLLGLSDIPEADDTAEFQPQPSPIDAPRRFKAREAEEIGMLN